MNLLEKLIVGATAVAAGFPLVLGFEAFVVAADPPTKLVGALLCLFAVGAISPLFFVIFNSASVHLHAACFWGSLAGIAAATVLLYVQYTVGDRSWWVVFWWALLALSVLSLIFAARRVGAPQLGSREMWAAIAAVVTSTAVVGVVQYWYRTYYAPLGVVPVLDVTSKLKVESEATHHIVPLDVVVTIKNPTSVAIQPLASLLTVSGLQPVHVKLNAQRFRNTIDSAVPGGLATTPGYRYVAFRRALVAAGQLLSTDAVIPADDTKVIHLIIDLPSRKPRFMEAALRIQMAFVQTVRLSLVPVGHPTGCRSHQSEHTNDVCVDFEKAHRTYTSAVVTEWKIPRRTWLARLTSDQRYVLAAVVQARGPFCYVQTVPTNWCPVLGTYFGSDTPYVFATANAGSGNADRADPGRLGKYYFVSLVTATGVAQIPPAPKAKTSGASVSKP